jgi:uncharacterized membrane protein
MFMKGLLAILPAVVTIYLVFWLCEQAEAVLGAGIAHVLPERWYVPGMGLVAGAGLVMVIGLLMQGWVFRWVFGLGERLLERMPLVKSIYGSVKDMTMLFRQTSEEKQLNQVVLVDITDAFRLVGFVTREDVSDLPSPFQIGDEETVGVYLPMSYQLGGFTVFLPSSMIKPVDMSVEEGMRFALTAGVSTSTTSDPAEDPNETKEENS